MDACGGYPTLGGPYNKDYSIWGSMLGYPNFGKLPCGRRATS